MICTWDLDEARASSDVTFVKGELGRTEGADRIAQVPMTLIMIPRATGRNKVNLGLASATL
jgi:hypothetical protein